MVPTHRRPPLMASDVGWFGSWTTRVTEFRAGLIRETVRANSLATHRLPST